MKFIKSKTLLLSGCLLLTSCSVLQSLTPIPTIQIPNEFNGMWADKKKPSTAYCYPPQGMPDYALWHIKSRENSIHLVGYDFYQMIGFYSLSPTEFSGKAKVSDPYDEEGTSITHKKIFVKLLNKNTIQIDGKNYYRCPKSPH